jgi:intracellular sulfur oxidation DsrE/DsrF family protein
MKTKFFIAVVMLMTTQISFAQKNYKVVFDLTSGDSLSQQTAIRWLTEVVKAEPTAQVELVMFGKGLPLAINGRSAVADGVAQLVNYKNVNIYVCSVAMANQHVDKSQLLPGVQTVPDGIYEIISKQQQGWGYIKVAH